jgi:hypothetical protein
MPRSKTSPHTTFHNSFFIHHYRGQP